MLGDLQILLTALAANGEDLPHLETSRAKLETMIDQAADAATRQATAAAVKQEATKQLQTLMTDSTRLGNALRAMIKEHYGVRSEKLAEFGIQPFRGRPGRRSRRLRRSPASRPARLLLHACTFCYRAVMAKQLTIRGIPDEVGAEIGAPQPSPGAERRIRPSSISSKPPLESMSGENGWLDTPLGRPRTKRNSTKP